MEAKKVRKGVGIRFAPVRRLLDMQTTKRLQRSLASYFFPPLPTFPILQSLWGSSGNLRMEVRSLGYRIRSFMGEEEEEEGIGNDVSPKVTDQPEFCRCAFPVDFLCFSNKKKKVLLVEKKSSDYPSIRVPSSSSLSKSTRFSAINYFRHAEQPFGQSSFQN